MRIAPAYQNYLIVILFVVQRTITAAVAVARTVIRFITRIINAGSTQIASTCSPRSATEEALPRSFVIYYFVNPSLLKLNLLFFFPRPSSLSLFLCDEVCTTFRKYSQCARRNLHFAFSALRKNKKKETSSINRRERERNRESEIIASRRDDTLLHSKLRNSRKTFAAPSAIMRPTDPSHCSCQDKRLNIDAVIK